MWFYIPVTGAAEVQLRIFALFVTISHVVEEIVVEIVAYLHLGMSKMERSVFFSWCYMVCCCFVVSFHPTPCVHKHCAGTYLPLEFRCSLQVMNLLLGKIQGQKYPMQEMGIGWTQWGLKTSSVSARSTWGNTCPSPSDCLLTDSSSQSPASL